MVTLQIEKSFHLKSLARRREPMVCVTDASFCRLPVPWVWATPSESQVVIFDGREQKEEENKGIYRKRRRQGLETFLPWSTGAGVKGEDAQFTERDNHQFKVVKQNSDWKHLVPYIGHECRKNGITIVNLS